MWKWGRERVGVFLVEVIGGERKSGGNGASEEGDGGKVDVRDGESCNESLSQTSQL